MKLNNFLVLIGSGLNHIPYRLIPVVGYEYHKNFKTIENYNLFSLEKKKEFIFKKVFDNVHYAIDRIPFYGSLYKKKGFELSSLKSFEDIKRIPIITKQDLMEVPLDQRSVIKTGCYKVNTGGSTGIPLSFYKTRDLQIKEVAYYNRAWNHLDFEQSDVRLQFVGRSTSDHLSYDITRNRITASVYLSFANLVQELSEITSKINIRYLQGYPSVLYEFALFLRENPQSYLYSGLKGKIKGIFLNSEYPYPEYRFIIEDVFKAKSIASYGHTEGCSLAFDYGDSNYIIEQSYGFTEAVLIEGNYHLVGTSFNNYSSPFIRYDTGDIIDSIEDENGILKSFRMTDGGRSGQYILDRNNKKISLTGLIFGRHHKLFNYCKQLQVSQAKPGCATIYYVADEFALKNNKPEDLFDAGAIDMDFKFERISEPIRTKSGKVLLLVK